MNNLSWFIYLTQVVDGLRELAVPVLIIGGLAYGAAAIAMTAIAHGEYSGDRWEEEFSKLTSLRKSISRVAVPVLVLCVTVLVVVPSRQTMLLIAGSEMGERAIKSEAVIGIVNPGMDLVRLWIKQETDKLKKKAE